MAPLPPALAQERALGEWIIPAGREAVVRALVGAIQLGGAAGGGFATASIRIEFDRIALVLRRETPPAEQHTLELVHATQAARGDVIVGSIALRAPHGTPPSLVDAVRAGLARHGERELPWVHRPGAAGTATGEGRRERSESFPWWAFASTVGAGLALTALAAWVARRRSI